jgi:CspA family cold shock protein
MSLDIPPGAIDATGTVRDWYSTEGWGVLVAPDVEGTVFAHFSVIDLPGNQYRELHAGQPVEFKYTTPGQDGCDHTAQYVKGLGPADG